MWGGTAMFAKGVTLPSVHIICIRSMFAALALFLIMLYLKIPIILRSRKDYTIMTALSILTGLHWVTYFEALKVSTAAVAIIALHIYPVLTALVEPFVFKEKFKVRDLFLAIIVFIGLFIMMPEFDLKNDITKGILLGVISGFFFTGRNLMTRKYVREYSSYTLMFWQVNITALLLLPVLFYMKPVNYSTQNMLLLLVMVVIFTIVG